MIFCYSCPNYHILESFQYCLNWLNGEFVTELISEEFSVKKCFQWHRKYLWSRFFLLNIFINDSLKAHLYSLLDEVKQKGSKSGPQRFCHSRIGQMEWNQIQ